MRHPLLLEINTRCWLRAWSDHLARPVTLANVPEKEFKTWKERGFTHVWLMGVWATGPKTRDLARAQPNLRALSAQAFGKRGQEKLVSSPYAVADFTVAEALGGAEALRKFRGELHQHGLALVLDFIPNHLGLDHPWLTERSDLFVRSAAQRPETFPNPHAGAGSWVAHGKDPYFPAWVDTAQLDYRRASTRMAMKEVLLSIASQCDGARCDTAMLVLNDVFDKTWAHYPARDPAPQGEFWTEAIAAVRRRQPQFIFIAEAYWDLEPRLQALGFDFVYDKKFLDYLARRDYPALQEHVRAVCGNFHPVRFLENHDEARIAAHLSMPEQKAAAVLLLAQPGLRLLYEGQWSGHRRHTPVQFACHWPETGDPEMTAFYERLLSSLAQTAIGRGAMEFLETGVAPCFAMKWEDEAGRISLAVVNLAPQRADFQIRAFERGGEWMNVFFDDHSSWTCRGGELHIELAGHGFVLLELRMVVLSQ